MWMNTFVIWDQETETREIEKQSLPNPSPQCQRPNPRYDGKYGRCFVLLGMVTARIPRY